MRARNGIASHSSSVRRPGKLRLPMCMEFSFPSSCPAIAGKGDRALARWKGRGPRSYFCNDNEAPSQRPPPPPFGTADASRWRALRKVRRLKAAYAPSPAFAGADNSSSFSRCGFASELCFTL
jgi:hypothetical protein